MGSRLHIDKYPFGGMVKAHRRIPFSFPEHPAREAGLREWAGLPPGCSWLPAEPGDDGDGSSGD